MRGQQLRAQEESAAAIAEQRRLLAQQREQAINDQAALDLAAVPGASIDQIIAGLPGHMHAKVREDYGKADEAGAKAAKAKVDYETATSADAKGGRPLEGVWLRSDSGSGVARYCVKTRP
jgi:hypothetical protein